MLQRTLLIATLTLVSTTDFAMSQTLPYPESKTVDVSQEYFGQTVADPYQWLEQDVRESEDVSNWVEAQNELTFGYIKELPFRKEIETRLTQLWDYEKFGTPFKRGGRYYYFKNDGLQNQSVLYRQETLRIRAQSANRSQHVVGRWNRRVGRHGV